MKFKHLAVATACLAGASQAAVINGRFNHGLTGWQTLGDVSVQHAYNNPLGLPIEGASSTLILTTASLYDDDVTGLDAWLNLSGQQTVDVNTDLAAFVGSTATDLELDPVDHTISAIEGSAARQNLLVSAGDTLSFQWNLLTRDLAQPDTAWLVLSPISESGSAQIFTLGQSPSAGLILESSITNQTGWQSFQYTFSSTGYVGMSLAVADMNDWGQTSMLAVQNVQITAVPEPESAGLAIAALALIGVQLWRRRLG